MGNFDVGFRETASFTALDFIFVKPSSQTPGISTLYQPYININGEANRNRNVHQPISPSSLNMHDTDTPERSRPRETYYSKTAAKSALTMSGLFRAYRVESCEKAAGGRYRGRFCLLTGAATIITPTGISQPIIPKNWVGPNQFARLMPDVDRSKSFCCRRSRM